MDEFTLPLLYLCLDRAAADEGDTFKPHLNPYLVATHHQFLMEATVVPIWNSRRICEQLKDELRQVRPAALLRSPSCSPKPNLLRDRRRR